MTRYLPECGGGYTLKKGVPCPEQSPPTFDNVWPAEKPAARLWSTPYLYDVGKQLARKMTYSNSTANTTVWLDYAYLKQLDDVFCGAGVWYKSHQCVSSFAPLIASRWIDDECLAVLVPLMINEGRV
jgi:hypothetical protein